jgi:hypothetical protein
MKQFFTLALTLFSGILAINARPVNQSAARSVAISFYQQNCGRKVSNLELAHSENSLSGDALYFVFNVNANEGFVIIAADDAAHPIIGYSTEGRYVIPGENTTIKHWMSSRAREIQAIRSSNVAADELIQNEWRGNFNRGSSNNKVIGGGGNIYAVVGPLLQTTWNQSPNYNALCPGGSVTGCVATAMAQIMKYWNYPNTGTGSSSYCDCTGMGFQMNYGTLTANYAAATYSWNLMPNNLGGANAAVATLMLHCGISVNMDYSPSGSGAWVITSDNPVCAQNSYTTYFKYDPATIQGLMRIYYSDPNWISLLENELNIGRPLQYVGYEPTGEGHTWVLDGYDISNNFHMNWGWGGYDNGYYAINLLNPNPYNFSIGHEALIGIKPLPYADFSMSANPACVNQSIVISDLSANNPTSWSYTMPGATPSVAVVANPTVTYSSPGIYSITLVTSNITNTSIPIVKTITVGSTPTIVANAVPVCSGSTGTISLSGALSYSLNNNPVAGASAMVSPTATTVYTITGFNGCVNTRTVSVMVNPTPTVSIAGSQNVCAGSQVTLTASGASTYSWNNGSTNNVLVDTPTANTVYFVDGSNGLCSAVSSVQINYLPTPNVSVNSSDSLICPYHTATLTALGANTYSWSNGSNLPIIAVSPSITTTYTVIGTGPSGCSSKVIVTQNVSCLCTGIAEHQLSENKVVIFPNPNDGVFVISMEKLSDASSIEIYNSMGQLISRTTPGSRNMQMDISSQAAGVYYVRVADNVKTVFSTRILKN